MSQAEPQAAATDPPADHRRLRDLLREVEAALAAQTITDAVEGLTAFLATHFEHEERSDGFFQDVLALAPQRAEQVSALRAEHGFLLTEAEQTLQQWHAAQRHTQSVLDRLRHHEQREEVMMQETLEHDLGRGD